jgi:hypothetical protein
MIGMGIGMIGRSRVAKIGGGNAVGRNRTGSKAYDYVRQLKPANRYPESYPSKKPEAICSGFFFKIRGIILIYKLFPMVGAVGFGPTTR